MVRRAICPSGDRGNIGGLGGRAPARQCPPPSAPSMSERPPRTQGFPVRVRVPHRTGQAAVRTLPWRARSAIRARSIIRDVQRIALRRAGARGAPVGAADSGRRPPPRCLEFAEDAALQVAPWIRTFARVPFRSAGYSRGLRLRIQATSAARDGGAVDRGFLQRAVTTAYAREEGRVSGSAAWSTTWELGTQSRSFREARAAATRGSNSSASSSASTQSAIWPGDVVVALGTSAFRVLDGYGRSDTQRSRR